MTPNYTSPFAFGIFPIIGEEKQRDDQKKTVPAGPLLQKSKAAMPVFHSGRQAGGRPLHYISKKTGGRESGSGVVIEQ